ncbi:unnamed protein product, partial [Ectocarpus sp. 12 AP-2014]
MSLSVLLLVCFAHPLLDELPALHAGLPSSTIDIFTSHKNTKKTCTEKCEPAGRPSIPLDSKRVRPRQVHFVASNTSANHAHRLSPLPVPFLLSLLEISQGVGLDCFHSLLQLWVVA